MLHAQRALMPIEKAPALAQHAQRALMPMKQVPALAQLARLESMLPARD